ncbi:cystathionine beta-lyase [Methylobacterium sp. Leaf99]|uniref:c-type cytochrome n=1 Tax=Methylobacterium sp. Leaf99 TaxID=1736251 RepID=UPI0006F524B1|nr:cytochrome c family protein [Methylobacterium sp. Leaf99]KQP07935.1 cystathionine beta-lyase [Methylobacterium sp. Leaf99]
MRPHLLAAAFAIILPTFSAQAQDAAAGEKVFTACKACHALGKNSVGPNLVGVVGRKAASYEGYNYSTALKESGITWDEANLKEWLTGPAANKVKGTKMVYQGLKDEKKVADVIAYLATLK